MYGEVNEVMTIYQIVTKALFNTTEEFRNIHHYEFDAGDPSTTEMQAFIDEFDGELKTHVQAYFSSLVSVYAYDVRRVDVGDLPTIEYIPTAGAWNGTDTSDPLPPQNAAMVTWKALTAFPRTTRSYMFPFTGGSTSSEGIMTGTARTALQTWANAIIFITPSGGMDGDKICVEYGGDPRAVVAHNDVATVTVKAVYRTQRRRTYNVGI